MTEDYSKPYILIKRLLKEFYNASIRGEMTKAYEISVDIAEVANQLEQIAQELANESNA